MGTPARLLLLVLLLLTLVACEKKEEAGVRTTVYDKVEALSRDQVPEKPILLPPQQQEYLDTAAAQLARLDRQVDTLKQKIASLPEAARAEYAEKLQDLQRARRLVQEKMNLLRDAGAEAWHEIEPGFKSAMADFEQGVQTLADRLGGS